MSGATRRLRSILLFIAEFYVFGPLARRCCDILVTGHESFISDKFRHLRHFFDFFSSSPSQAFLG